MNKKNYKAPHCEVISIGTPLILSGSFTATPTGETNAGYAGDVRGGEDGMGDEVMPSSNAGAKEYYPLDTYLEDDFNW